MTLLAIPNPVHHSPRFTSHLPNQPTHSRDSNAIPLKEMSGEQDRTSFVAMLGQWTLWIRDGRV